MRARWMLVCVSIAGCLGPAGDPEAELTEQAVASIGPEPYRGSLPEDAVLPDGVDHRPFLSPVRDQGDTNRCLSFAFTAAVEAYHGLHGHLSVEQMRRRLLVRLPWLLPRRLEGVRLAPEAAWPVGGTRAPNIDERSRWGIDDLVSTGVSERTLMRYLAEGPSFNVVVLALWDQEHEEVFGLMPGADPTRWHRLREMADLGQWHAFLVVGYQRDVDWDGVTRTFFIVKNSWGTDWGDDGYGYVSSRYLEVYGLSGWLVLRGP